MIRSRLYGLFSRLAAAVRPPVPPGPPPALSFAADPQRDLYDLVYQTDLADPRLNRYNDTRRDQRRNRLTGDPLTLHWLVPEPTGAGSGGHMNIVQFVRHLQQAGFHNRLYSLPNRVLKSDADMRAVLVDHYGDIGDAETHIDASAIPPGDICVATGWDTAYRLYALNNTLFKVYLVQDFEPMFHGMGSHYLFAENTYRMNFYGIFGSPWLHDLMRDRYGFNGFAFRYGYNPAIYRPLPGLIRNPDQVAVYIRPRTIRRGFELLMGALQILKRLRPQTRVVLYGSAEPITGLPFACEQPGLLGQDQLAALYNSSALLLLTSLTNYSIIPVEAMACGAAVVDVRAPSIQSVFQSDQHLLLCDLNPWDMARRTAALLDAPRERDRLAHNAADFVRDMTWDKTYRDMARRLWDAFGAN